MRHKILYVSPQILIELCKGPSIAAIVVKNVLPSDTKFIRAFNEDTSGWGQIGLVLESDQFEELKEGDLIPVLPKPVFEKIQ